MPCTDKELEFGNRVEEWWEDLSFSQKADIYEQENPDEFLTEEEKADIRGDMKCHELMEQGLA